jgi:hypothetical protein
VLPHGAIDARLSIEASLNARRVADPISLAPDVWYGASDQVTVGVITSGDALPRIQVGDGLCHGCDRLYDNLGLDLRVAWSPRVAFESQLVLRSFDPWKPSWRPGLRVHLARGAFAFDAAPQLWLGLANVDRGNADELSVPVWGRVFFWRAEAWLYTGVRGELAGFGEKYAIPVALGFALDVHDTAVGLQAGAPELLGPQNQVKDRSMFVFAERRIR